jgi:penicillin-insensitive murein endopeptidase
LRVRRARLALISFVASTGAIVLGAASAGEAGNAWSRIEAPSAGPPLSIGSAANGCLSGAEALPLDGPGYAVIRPSRRRYYGHRALIDFIEGIGRRAKASGLPTVQIGDMSQPRGGPLPFGHASHQTGLDADIWFTFAARPNPGARERENPDLPSMLAPGAAGIDPARFGRRQVTLLRLAASDPRVDRIFVNPAIKLALCQGFGGATVGGKDWLRRLRPWWGHDDHFHARLRCPADSPACEPQAPIPEGDGCDASLEDWARQRTVPATPAAPPRPKSPPASCAAVLKEIG